MNHGRGHEAGISGYTVIHSANGITFGGETHNPLALWEACRTWFRHAERHGWPITDIRGREVVPDADVRALMKDEEASE